MKAAIAALIISLSLSTVSNAQVSCEQVGNFTYCDNGQHFQNNQGNSSQFGSDVSLNNADFVSLDRQGNAEIASISAAPASISAAPLPAALPLFATGLGAMGLLGWWRKRKARADT